MIEKIERSPKKHKRFRVTMDNGKTYDFGLDTGSTYIDHHDKIKRANYWKRHLANETEHKLFVNLVPSASILSLCILWGPSTSLEENIKILNDLWQGKYHTGAGQKDGYIKRLIAENKFDLSKIKNPSQWLLNKFGEVAQQQQPVPEPEPQAPQHEQPIFQPNENVEYNVGKPKKKKAVNSSSRQLTEAQEEKAQEQRVNKNNYLQNLKTNLVECRKDLQKENSKFMDVLDEVRARKGLKKTERTELEQAVRSKYVKNINKIKGEYKSVFQYIRSNGLNENDLNSVYKYISNQIKTL